MNIKKYFAEYLLFPSLVLLIPLLGMLVYLRFEAPAALVSNLCIVGGGLIILIFEYQVPFNKDWNKDHGDTKTDILYAVVNICVFAVIEVAILFIAHRYFNFGLLKDFIRSITNDSWFFELLVFYLLVELLQYLHHRFSHATNFLWRLHEIHHSLERLYSVNSLKIHAVEALMRFGIPMVTLAVIGGSTQTMMVYSIQSSIVGLLQHGNIKMNLRFWNLIFSTSDLHRVHHSANVAESKKNFGKTLALYDLLFGTYSKFEVSRIGNEQSIPKKYWKQLLFPFRK